MIKNVFTLTQLISGLAIVLFLYFKTKDKWILQGFLLLAYCSIMFAGFRILYPNMPIPAPTIQYMILLTITGIPFLIMLLVIANEISKNREKSMASINSIFTMNRGNIIFWGIIILLNLVGFILDVEK
jgi:hypothetical protein